MKVLILHPEDSPWGGPWSRSHWDLVVDLGYASPFVYNDWSRRLGARVISIHQFGGQKESYRWIKQLRELGRGRLLDRLGLDWWDLLSVWNYQTLHALYLLHQVRRELDGARSELTASRPHLYTKILGQVLDRPVRYFHAENTGAVQRLSRMLGAARRLRPAQIIEIAFDKWDSGYRLRRHLTKYGRARLTDPVVLMPSTYSNVTRSVLAYAAHLPHRRFLLATTRRSARPKQLPDNVTAAPLSAYAVPSRVTFAETRELRNAWELLLQNMTRELQEFRSSAIAGIWDYFPPHLEVGLRLREAWRQLLQSEPVKGVLCGDDLNYYTALPLILASRAGLNAVYCSHGALDGGFLFKAPLADSYLVKGEMERDYLQSAGAVEPHKICVGAPGVAPPVRRGQGKQPEGELVFFSQPYEVDGGRTHEIYREVLPRLYAAAHRTGRRLIVKLHPFESMQGRKALVTSILPKDAHSQVQFVGGVPAEEVMSRTWCGVTVDSSVTVECALRGIPFFLCGWLDFSDTGYLQQFARFGAGRVLDSPEMIDRIPEIVADFRPDPAAILQLWHEADSARLDQILFGARRTVSRADVPEGISPNSSDRVGGERQSHFSAP
jgi:hypothetical protein